MGTPVDNSDLEQMLKVADLAIEAAEAHGEFCGRACLDGAAAIPGSVTANAGV